MAGKIHPGRLLYTLKVLLSPSGGIKSSFEVFFYLSLWEMVKNFADNFQKNFREPPGKRFRRFHIWVGQNKFFFFEKPTPPAPPGPF